MTPSLRVLRRLSTTLVLTIAFGGLALAAPAPAAERAPATESVEMTLPDHTAGSARPASLTLPFRANVIGVTYAGERSPISVRTHTPGGGWSDWRAIENSDIAPDPGSAERTRSDAERRGRHATDPMWVGLTDAVQVRAGAGARAIKIVALNTLGNARPESLLARAAHAVGRWLRGAPQQSEAVPAVPTIQTRAQWGADESWRRCCPRYSPTVEAAIVHHTDNNNSYSQADAPAMVRAIYRYHRFSLDYDDIAYNFLVDRFGTIYEGRYGGMTLPLTAAHSEGMNYKTTGIALIGTFQYAYPAGAMTVALEKLLAWKLDLHHIPASGTVPMTSSGSAKLSKGQVVQLNRISGHRDVQSTDCPGNRLYGMLTNIRTTVMSWGAPKMYLNSTPQVLRPDGDTVDETVATKVWMSGTLHWSISFVDGAGTIRKTVTGTGTVAQATWDGIDTQTSALAPTGKGSITIDAWDDANKHATLARIPLYVVNKHPAGSVIKNGAAVLTVDTQGISHMIPSAAVFASRYRSNEGVIVTSQEGSRYTPGTPVAFREGTLLKAASGAYWWISGGSRHAFASSAVFTALGYADAAAIAIADSELSTIPLGTQIADTTVHPPGSVVAANGSSYVITGSGKQRLTSLVARRSWYRDAEVVTATAGDLALPDGSVVTFREGTLLKTVDGAYWIVSGGKRVQFSAAGMFAALGFKSAAAFSVTWPDLNALSYGGTI